MSACVAVAIGVAAFPSAAAAADSIQITVQTATPEQSVPVQIAFSGSAAADSSSNAAVLVAVARPAGGIGCQATASNDGVAAGSESKPVVGDIVDPYYYGKSVGPGTYQLTGTFDPPGPGSYLVCAWIEDESGSVTTTASASATFSARGPQVTQLSVSLPKPARPNVAFEIAFTTQTDQQLGLYSDLKPAGGLPCASSYELESAQNQSLDDLFDGSRSVFGGPTTTTATATEKKGSYVICTWIEGPSNAEVDATQSTPIYVGKPPAPPKCVVPRVRFDSPLATVEAQLVAAHCVVGTLSNVHSKSVAKGDVIRLEPRPRTKLANSARVSIVVSTGPPKRHRRKHRRNVRR